MKQNNAALEFVKNVFGHSDIEITKKYIGFCDTDNEQEESK